MKLLLLGVVLCVATSSNLAAQELPLNVKEWRSAIEVIRLARQTINEGGWYQVEVISGAECMATALEKSWIQLDKSLVDWEYTKLAMNQVLDAPELSSLSLDSDPLSTPYWGRYYVYWNDADGRTKEEVLEAIDRAIDFALSEEQRALEVNANGNQVIEYDIQMMDKLGLPMSQRYR